MTHKKKDFLQSPMPNKLYKVEMQESRNEQEALVNNNHPILAPYPPRICERPTSLFFFHLAHFSSYCLAWSINLLVALKKIIEINPEIGNRLKNEVAKFKPNLIMNQVRSQNDVDLGFSIQTVSKKYFGIDLNYLGYLDYDASVWQSVKKSYIRPFSSSISLDFSNS